MTTYPRNTIQTLLDRFMDGQTTLDEERLLADFFRSSDDIPEEWEDYREMFAYFDRGMDDAAPRPSARTTAGTGTKSRRRYWAAAAVALLAIGLSALLLHDSLMETAVLSDNSIPTTTKPETNGQDTPENTLRCESSQAACPPPSPDSTTAIRTTLPTVHTETRQQTSRTAPPSTAATAHATAKADKTQPGTASPSADIQPSQPTRRKTENSTLLFIERQYREAAREIAMAQTETAISAIQAHGYQIVYYEDGSIGYTTQNTELTNIIEL
ncbi:hypothetical protein [Prevotella dentasini]